MRTSTGRILLKFLVLQGLPTIGADAAHKQHHSQKRLFTVADQQTLAGLATRGQYRLAFALDCTLLWGRLGGRYLFIAVVAAFFLSLMESMPGWVVPLSIGIGAAAGIIAHVRMRPYLSIAKNGVSIEGRVNEVERRERIVGVSDGGKRVQKRITYSYEFDGAELTGRIDWRGSGDFGTLDTGHSIPLVVDPERPAVAVWEKDMPIRMPETIGL